MFVTFGKHQASTAKSVDRMRLSHGKINTFEVFFYSLSFEATNLPRRDAREVVADSTGGSS